MVDFIGKPSSDGIDAAIRSLISVEHFAAGSLVTMPVLYPSGSSVVLEITVQTGRCFVTDRGAGRLEAELMGISPRAFNREASRVADDAGIQFNGHDMFVAEVGMDSLAGAMEVVASSSQTAVALSSMRISDKVERDAKELLFERLSEVYPTHEVIRDAEFIGSSNHTWKIAALVRASSQTATFEAVTKNYNSIVGAAAKFHDIARLEHSPRRIAVVASLAELGDYIGVIAPATTSIIELSASRKRFEESIAA
ncbi:hypothetical protein [Kaistia nematophila]|uniref:Uncharacterized protein n=1 Tax=Kaistia nematophila TaxID=2994654 RepID=A0A9X3IKF4_9HYPH|nr:hypothetical protein [Kaistia nematophila]MCX5569418.1 hypothetical protein [Kaistia nematophila]